MCTFLALSDRIIVFCSRHFWFRFQDRFPRNGFFWMQPSNIQFDDVFVFQTTGFQNGGDKSGKISSGSIYSLSMFVPDITGKMYVIDSSHDGRTEFLDYISRAPRRIVHLGTSNRGLSSTVLISVTDHL